MKLAAQAQFQYIHLRWILFIQTVSWLSMYLKLFISISLVQTVKKTSELYSAIASVSTLFIMSDVKESTANLNKELESIFANSNGTDEAIKYLKSYFRRSFIRRCIQFFILLGLLSLIYLLVYYIPILNWNASAIGRLALIKLILPAYNWQYLYNSRCLIEMSPTQQLKEADHQQEAYGEFKDEDCTVCESLGNFGWINI